MISTIQFLTRKRRLASKLREINDRLEILPKSSPAWFGYHIQQEMLLDELVELVKEYTPFTWLDFELN